LLSPLNTDLKRKLASLIATRALVSTLLLGGATVMQVKAPGSFPVDPFFLLIALSYALAIVYAVTLHLVDRHRWLIDLQLACDAIVVSAFISLTGGITSLFSLLYVLPIVAGSMVGFRRGGLLVATLSAVIFSGLVALQYLSAAGLIHFSWMPVDPNKLPSRSVAQYIVLLNLFGFFGVALLSGSLAEGVRSVGARLERASTEIADLQALPEQALIARFGKFGQRLAHFAHGEDGRRVTPDRPTKSISAETTFRQDTGSGETLREVAGALADRVASQLSRKDLAGRSVVLKLKTSDFRILTRTRSLAHPTQRADVIFESIAAMIDKEADGRTYRLIGVGMGDLGEASAADPTDLFGFATAGKASLSR